MERTLLSLLSLALLGSAGACSASQPATSEPTTGMEQPEAPPAPEEPASSTPAAASEPPPAPEEPIIAVDPATAPAAVAIKVPKNIEALLAAKDRTEEDRALDAGRHPGELLTFFGVKPGMKVAELFAGGGYTAELLARAVGKKGTVYGQNSAFVLERFAAGPWAARLERPVNKNIIRVDRELDDPLPPEAKDLDIVFSVLFYHDSVWQGTDRDKMNKAVFDALKPGGVYAVVDHSGRSGTGTSETKTLHRIEQSEVVAEIERAGFKLEAEGFFMRNPQDARDWNDAPSAAAERRGTSDRFVLKFVKPK